MFELRASQEYHDEDIFAEGLYTSPKLHTMTPYLIEQRK